MKALVLKSQNVLSDKVEPINYTLYKTRVLLDGGIIVDEQSAINTFKFLEVNNIPLHSVFVAASAKWGVKQSENEIEKLYSLGGASGDIVGMKKPMQLDGNSIVFPVSADNGVKSIGNAKATSALSTIVAHTITDKYTNGDFGSLTKKTLAVLNNVGATEPNYFKKQQRLYYTGGNVADVTQWTERGDIVYGTQGLVIDIRKLATGTVKGNPKFLANHFENNTGTLIGNGGTVLASKSYTLNISDDYYAHFGIDYQMNSDGSEYIASPFAGSIQEFWCLVDASIETTKLITTRAL